jgi:hypothetical protein
VTVVEGIGYKETCNSPNRGSGKYRCDKEKYHEGTCMATSKWGGRVFWVKPEGWDDARP